MREQAERLFKAIGDVGDDLIVRADAPVKAAPRVWHKWAALAACCALVIGAAALVLPLFRAGSSAPETASLQAEPAETPALTTEAAPAEAPESMLESAAPEAEDATGSAVRAVPGADCFAVQPESVTRTAADAVLTDETGAVRSISNHYWLERLEDGAWKLLEADQPQLAREQDEASADGSAARTLHYDWSAIYGALPAGEYRLAQPVVLADETDCTLYAQFTVE